MKGQCTCCGKIKNIVHECSDCKAKVCEHCKIIAICPVTLNSSIKKEMPE